MARVNHGDNDNDDSEEDDDNHGGNKNKKKWEWLRILDVEKIRVNSNLIFREFANYAVLVTSISSPFQQVSNNSTAAVRVYKIVVATNANTYI